VTLAALLLGLAAGTHTATWGMYKDAPHEGFTWRRYARSILLGGLLALALAASGALRPASAADAVVFFGLVYVIERALVEFYKTFLREEDQSKYFIPMQFAVHGRVVQDRRTRLAVGAAVAATVLALAALAAALPAPESAAGRLAAVFFVGSAGGWLSAFGGAWKDAPHEGFETLKFFRSPALAFGYALLLAHLTDRLLFIAAPALGYTIATIETYKTFFFPSKPRGKFAGRPVLHPEMLRRRQRFVPLYAAIWAGVLALFLLAFLGPRRGLF